MTTTRRTRKTEPAPAPTPTLWRIRSQRNCNALGCYPGTEAEALAQFAADMAPDTLDVYTEPVRTWL